MASVGSILSGAFRLFKEQPITVAIWAVIFTLYGVASNLLAMGNLAGDLETMRAGGAGGNIGLSLLMVVVSLVFSSVMACAVYRVVLRRDERSFAGLRLGMDELRMMGLFLILIVAGIFLAIVFVLFLMLVVGGTMAAMGNSMGSILTMIGLYLAVWAALVYFSVRFSLVFAMTFVRRRIAIDAGWALTRGHFWKLFLAYLVLVVMLLVLFFTLIFPLMGPFLGEMMQMMRNPEAMRSASAQVDVPVQPPLMTMILLTVLGAVLQTIAHTVFGGAVATAVRELLRDQGEVLDDDIEATAQIFE